MAFEVRAPRKGFLRPRGDAPDRGLVAIDVAPVPPPTRRCTRAASPRRSSVPGSSAHAEMHPARGVSAKRRSWFLRPRGDAPRRSASRPRAARVPPPTRRCTGGAAWMTSISRGSSAHAEMHPTTSVRRSGRRRFLRPRGDAPVARLQRRLAPAVPPPTRRCTDQRLPIARLAHGSSAHAEMHRDRARPRRGGARFLRPRGDAPVEALSRGLQLLVPPPTRRCTHDVGAQRLCPSGSSAHAEMHPRRRASVRPPRRFLRPRGDAPPRG